MTSPTQITGEQAEFIENRRKALYVVLEQGMERFNDGTDKTREDNLTWMLEMAFNLGMVTQGKAIPKDFGKDSH